MKAENERVDSELKDKIEDFSKDVNEKDDKVSSVVQ
jgi:hypothetical protein